MTLRQQRQLDRQHLRAAMIYAELSPARRMQVGCVIARYADVLAIGWNSMPDGYDSNCEFETEAGLITRPEVIHAEARALMRLASSNESSALATVYLTHAPCLECAKLLVSSRISRVCYAAEYRDTAGLELCRNLGLITEQIDAD